MDNPKGEALVARMRELAGASRRARLAVVGALAELSAKPTDRAIEAIRDDVALLVTLCDEAQARANETADYVKNPTLPAWTPGSDLPWSERR